MHNSNQLNLSQLGQPVSLDWVEFGQASQNQSYNWFILAYVVVSSLNNFNQFFLDIPFDNHWWSVRIFQKQQCSIDGYTATQIEKFVDVIWQVDIA